MGMFMIHLCAFWEFKIEKRIGTTSMVTILTNESLVRVIIRVIRVISLGKYFQ